MIVKNEEKYLRDCLESVKGVVDEIILVDTGSKDSTLLIAQEYGAKIFNFEWINDFSAARNYSLSQCTGNWILYLDADERLSAKSRNHLKLLTSKNDKIAYYCQVCSIDEVNSRPSIMSYVRLFPNEESLKFEGAIHEQIEYSLQRNKIPIIKSSIEILHVGYNLNNDGLILKAKRNLDILLSEYSENNSSYYAFQLGQTYGILENKKDAVKYFQIAVQDHSLKPEYKSTAYRYLSIDLAEKQDWINALEFIDESIRNDANQPLALLAASQIYLKLSRFADAESLCRKAYEVNSKLLKESSHSNQVILLSKQDILYNCMNIAIMLQNASLFNYFYKELGNFNFKSPDAQKNIEMKLFDILLNNKIIEKNNLQEFLECINKNNLNVFISILERYNIMDSKILILNAISVKFPRNSIILNKLGLVLSNLKKIEEAELAFEKSFEINPDDPSTVFYLISIYLQKNNFQRINFLIEFAKNKFSDIPAIIEKLSTVEQKISAR
jgi:glycosyltransferase involved in cell wall biosynthesis